MVGFLVLEVEHLLGVPTPDDDEIVHEKGDTFAPWLTSDSTVDEDLQSRLRTLCTKFYDIFSNDLPKDPANNILKFCT